MNKAVKATERLVIDWKKVERIISLYNRIVEYEVLDEHFHVPYADRFQEGEFRKRIQFMFGGELRTIKFKYRGLSIESVLDRFPTAEIIDHDSTGWTVKAEVYGDGVDIWLRGQGDVIEVIDWGK